MNALSFKGLFSRYKNIYWQSNYTVFRLFPTLLESKNITINRMSSVIMKPPNIMIFTGMEGLKEDYHFKECKEKLSKHLNVDCYVFYPLTIKQICDKEPWPDNTTLLVITHQCNIIEEMNCAFLKYFKNGGRLLSLSHNLYRTGTEWQSMSQRCSGSSTLEKTHSELAIIEIASEGKGIAIHCQDEHLDDEILRNLLCKSFGLNCHVNAIDNCITDAYFFGKTPRDLGQFEEYVRLNSEKTNILKLKNAKVICCPESLQVTKNDFEADFSYKVITKSETPQFLHKIYFSELCTKRFGRCVIYSDVVNSTMDFVEGLTDDLGLLVVSKKQLSGKGRGGNKWLSPEGCAMFTLQIWIPLRSALGRALPFIQHLVALAVVHSVRSRPGYQNLDLRLKWPNDIYVGGFSKIGGVLVSSTHYGESVQCIVGCGVNLNNPLPTLCINGLIDKEVNLVKLSLESFVANTLNCLESLIDDFEDRAQHCLSLYYRYWIHQNQELTIAKTKEKVKVIGLDDFGFLSVMHVDGTTSSLQPDGNSLDMMNNLIKVKI